ncbi:MAG: permease, partial [Bacteroidales bacterium]
MKPEIINMHGAFIYSIADYLKSLFYNFLNHYEGSYTKRVLEEALILLGDLWPYLVLGIIATSLIKLYISKNRITEFFQNRKNLSIVLAALIGVVSPLGSYIIIPLSAALFLMGTPLPVLMSLIMSSPLINPNLFLLTAGAFGYEMAVLRLLSAFLLGIAAGYFTLWLINIKYILPEIALNKNNHPNIALNKQTNGKPLAYKFGIEIYKMTIYISKYFFLGILLAATIKILIPPNLMIKLFRGNNFLSVLFSTGAGIPFYVCGGAAIPVVQQLADLGMNKG